MFKKINFYQLVITIAAVLFASVLIVYGWSAPLGGPPGNDVPAPINTGDYLQVKDGPFFVSNKPNSFNFGLSVLSGNLIVGSTTVVKEKTGVGDTFSIINTRDVWLRDANKWASELGGDIIFTSISGTLSGASNYTYSGTKKPSFLIATIYAWGGGNCEGSVSARWLNNSSGAVIKDWVKISGTNIGNGNDGGSGMGDMELATIPFIEGSNKIEFRPNGCWGYTMNLVALGEKDSTTSGGNDRYQISCDSGHSTIYCCQVDQTNGDTACRSAGVPMGNWGNLPSPFSAGAAGRYNITLTEADYWVICQTNAMTRATVCKYLSGNNWVSIGNPW